MYSFCPHCGQTLGQEQVEGRALICRHCAKAIGIVSAPKKAVVVDETEELIRRGTVARCPLCEQIVQIKTTGTVRSFVPHQGKAEPRKMCPNSGKQAAPASNPTSGEIGHSSEKAAPASPSPMRRPATSKDLSAYFTREVIKVIVFVKDKGLTIEELTLEYLDRSERVRLQIDALRDILGAAFGMKAYPAQLNRPHLAVWSNAAVCVVAQKHPQGGYQHMAEAEMQRILEEVQQQHGLFFP